MVHEKQYRFGRTVFRITSPEKLMTDGRFEAFAVPDDVEADYIYDIRPFPDRETADPSHPVRQVREGNRIHLFMDTSLLPKITVANLFTAADTGWLLPETGSFILHCAYVRHNGQALLISAPSQTGKSTLARHFFEKRGTLTVNQDRAIVFRDEGGYRAAGCWATGSARETANITLPIEAIVLLRQGSGNRVTYPRPSESLQRLMPQCTFHDTDPAQCDRMLEILCRMIPEVPLLSYECRNEPAAVDELEKYL